ncbi:MAG: hypothetical protein LAO76_11815 [Acidobacteriia bacterium]|nr:hypothetical protein [Terriglobia bacterium]
MKSKHRVLFRLVMAVLVQVLLMAAAAPVYAQPDLRKVPWVNKTPEERLIIKTLEITGGKVEIKGGLMVVPMPMGFKGIFKAPAGDVPLKIASGIGYQLANHSTSTVWLTVKVNAPGEKKPFEEDMELKPDYVSWRIWQPKNLQWNTPYPVTVTAYADEEHGSVLGTLNASWVFPEEDRSRLEDATKTAEQNLRDRTLVRFFISGWPEKASAEQLEAARKAKEDEHPVPPFEWKEEGGSPGLTLTALEKRRYSKQGSTWVEYDLRATGFQPGENLTMWSKWIDGTYGRMPFPISVDETGLIKMMYEGKPVEFHYTAGGMMAGEPISLALASADKRAYVRAIVVPIESKGEGGCAGSVEVQSPSGLLFLVRFHGFTPGEDLALTNELGKDKKTDAHHADDKGEARFPVLYSEGDHGKAKATAAGKECKVTLDYKVGKDAQVRR